MCCFFSTGYRPCEPLLVRDRIQALQAAYKELLELAGLRLKKLLDSQKYWQFMWDVAEEEGWIREKDQLMSSPDLGHDLPSVQLLLNKHKVFLFLIQSNGCFRK